MFTLPQKGYPFSATATGTATAVATQIGIANQAIYVTDLTASSDSGTATILVKDASNIIWQDRIGNVGAYNISFSTPIKVAPGDNLTVTVNGNAASYANVSGIMADTN